MTSSPKRGGIRGMPGDARQTGKVWGVLGESVWLSREATGTRGTVIARETGEPLAPALELLF